MDALCDEIHGDVDEDVVKAQSKEGSLFAFDIVVWIMISTCFCAGQVKKAIRARGKQPDKNREDPEATHHAEPANNMPAKGKGKGRGRGRGRKTQAPPAKADDNQEQEDKDPKSPARGGEDAKRKAQEAVQTPSKPSPNKKEPKQKKAAGDNAPQLQESWATQDWHLTNCIKICIYIFV